MKTVYDVPNDEMKDRLAAALEFHPELTNADVKISLQSVCKIDADEEMFPALKCRGMPAAAMVKKVSSALRIHLDADVLITVDLARWTEMTSRQQVAVMDHELEHIDLLLKDGIPVYDDRQRPRFKLKPDEIVLTGFSAIIRRHGQDALEYRSITSAKIAMDAAIAVFDAARVASQATVDRLAERAEAA